MISNSRQNWIVGHNVKVGFLTLKVRAIIETPGDYLPDAYILSNVAGTQLYSFVPHNGLTKISDEEARCMVQDQRSIERGREIIAAEQAALKAEVNSVFA
jgi:hypothetical protein